MGAMYGIDSEEDEDFSGEGGWINWYCSLKGHEALAEVEEEYMKDNFNLCGLRSKVQYFDLALEMILSTESPDEEDLLDSEFVDVYRDAVDLYALIHARYIISPRGLQVMRAKYLKSAFGTCPRVNCYWQAVLPVGSTEEARVSSVKLYCPRCEQLYCSKLKKADLDGAVFGPSFPHIFLQTYPVLVPAEYPSPFVPRVFGFKLHKYNSIVQMKLKEWHDDAEAQASTKDAAVTDGRERKANSGLTDPVADGARMLL